MTAPTMKVKVSFRTCRRGEVLAPLPKAVGQTSVARRIALAHHIEDLIDRGELRDYAEAAERLGLTRARMTQICDLALLAPDIQAAVLLGHVEPRDRHLREVGRHPLWTDQRRFFRQLFPDAPKECDHDCDLGDRRGAQATAGGHSLASRLRSSQAATTAAARRRMRRLRQV